MYNFWLEDESEPIDHQASYLLTIIASRSQTVLRIMQLEEFDKVVNIIVANSNARLAGRMSQHNHDRNSGRASGWWT